MGKAYIYNGHTVLSTLFTIIDVIFLETATFINRVARFYLQFKYNGLVDIYMQSYSNISCYNDCHGTN